MVSSYNLPYRPSIMGATSANGDVNCKIKKVFFFAVDLSPSPKILNLCEVLSQCILTEVIIVLLEVLLSTTAGSPHDHLHLSFWELRERKFDI